MGKFNNKFNGKPQRNGFKPRSHPYKKEEEPSEAPKRQDSNNKHPNKAARVGLKVFRIVVRNLPFTTTEEEFKALFDSFGTVKEVQLPKSKDPRFPKSIAGFGFVQFGARESARNAVEKLNFSQFKGRKIALDWSLHKDEYVSQQLGTSDHDKLMKHAAKYEDKVKEDEVKVEDMDEESDVSGSVVDEEDDDEAGSVLDEDEEEMSEIDEEDLEDEEEEELEAEDEEEEELESDEEDDVKEEMEDLDIKEEDDDEKPLIKKPKIEKEDAVAEGRAIFLRNVSFDTTNESLKKGMERFGEVKLAILCKFPGTDQKSGNAFVHFKDKEGAQKCLEELDISGIFLDGRIIEGHLAVPREETVKFETKKDKSGKDNRNLKLLRASLIRQGTAQSRNMSEDDEKSRQKLISASQMKLKNLHMFVSPTRLAIHNIPFSYRDDDLFNLCIKNATNKAYIKECRIMRDKKGVQKNGRIILGKSKGFGFVEFNNHLDALTCLRNLNNNPEAFSDEKRPIVEFSIENLNALKIKEKRLEQLPHGKNVRDDKNNKFETDKRNEAILKKTKQNLVKDGMKALPKKFGQKIRHRNSQGQEKGNKPGSKPQKQGFKINKLAKLRAQKRKGK